MKLLNNSILLPFLLILVLPLNAFAQLDSGYVTFGKSIFGLSIKHPTYWEVKEYDRHTRDDKVGYDLIVEMCPRSMIEHPDPELLPDYTQCSRKNEVVVSTANLPKDATMEEYMKFIQAGLKFDSTNYKQESLSDIVLAGLPAKKLLYTYFGEYQHQDEFIKGLQVTLFSGNKTYEIKYESPQLQFDDLLPTVEQMISTLKILPMPPCNFVRAANDTVYEGKCVLKP